MANSNQETFSPMRSLENMALRLRNFRLSPDRNDENNGEEEAAAYQEDPGFHRRSHGSNVSQERMINDVDSDAIKRQIAEQALTPSGSMSLQEQLNDKRSRDAIFEAIFPYMFEVMTHPCGTHVTGKLFERCDESQLKLVVHKIYRQKRIFFDSLFTKPGSNSVKKLIKALQDSSFVSAITSILVVTFIPLMKDRVASFVVMKCFDVLDAHQNEKLYEVLLKNCLELAMHETGCLSLKESMNYMRGPYRTHLLETICINAVCLSQDPSGNYVIQHVMRLQDPRLTSLICLALKGTYVHLSKQKYASHVVEKCLSTIGMDYVLEEFAGCDKLWQIARDQFGNYVLKRAILAAKMRNSEFYKPLLQNLDKNKDKFCNGFGKNVYYMVRNSNI